MAGPAGPARLPLGMQTSWMPENGWKECKIMTPVRAEYQVLFPEAQKAELVPAHETRPPGAPERSRGVPLTLISNGTELNVYLGNYEKRNLSWGRFPFVPGYAGTMEVETVGAT